MRCVRPTRHPANAGSCANRRRRALSDKGSIAGARSRRREQSPRPPHQREQRRLRRKGKGDRAVGAGRKAGEHPDDVAEGRR